jgi:hypothetical protein
VTRADIGPATNRFRASPVPTKGGEVSISEPATCLFRWPCEAQRWTLSGLLPSQLIATLDPETKKTEHSARLFVL